MLNRTPFLCFLLIFFHTFSALSKPNDGKRYFVMNLYKKAIESFSEGSDEESLYGLGMSYLKLGLLYKEMCDSLVALNIHYYELLLAREQYLRVVYEEAKNLDTSQYPEYDIEYAKYKSKYVRYYLSIAYCRNGEYGKSERMLRLFLQNVPVGYKDYALIALGEPLYLQGKKDEAIKVWDSISSKPNAYVASELAATYLRLNHIDKERFNKLVAGFDPEGRNEYELKRFHRNMAYIYLAVNELDDAKKYFDKIRLSQPCLVERLDKIERDDLALDVELEFFDPIIFDYLSKFYLANAREIFKSLISHRKYRLDALYGEAFCLYQFGDYETAVERLKELKGDDEVEGFAKILSGACLYKLGKKTDAVEEWEAVKKRYQTSPTLMVELAHAYAECEFNLKEAVRICSQALKTIYRNPKRTRLTEYPPMNAFPKEEIYRRMGKTFFIAGEIDDAINTYEIAHDAIHKGVVGMRRRGNDPALMLNLAFAYYKRSFNTYKEPTGTYSIMQQFYSEIYPLHNAMQGIFVIEGNLHGIKSKE